MKTFKLRLPTLIVGLSMAALCCIPKIQGQTLNVKLEQRTDFLPQTAQPVDQLVEVAQQFKIPMAIEWLEQANAKAQPAVKFRGGSVLQLLDHILQQSPEHQLLVEDRMVRIFSPRVVSHPFNFLNLQVSRYEVTNESLLGAQAMLRTWINMMFYPEQYQYGHNGGYGGDPDSVFWVPNINISGQDLTIREILTKIAEANGNALWVVHLTPEEFAGDKPKWIGVPINEYGHSPINSRWRFIALSEKRSDNDLERTRNSARPSSSKVSARP